MRPTNRTSRQGLWIRGAALAACVGAVVACDRRDRATAEAPRASGQAAHAEHAGHAGHAEHAGHAAGHAGHARDDAAGAYRAVVTPSGGVVRAGEPVELALELRDPAGARVTRVAVAHERLLHLIVVSRDLSHFAHEHPTRRDDGTFAIQLTFPRAGEYTLYHDFTPEGGRQVVAQARVRVEGDAAAPSPLGPEDLATAKTVGPFTVRATTSTREAGRDAMLSFAITRDGRPVTDLRPYLGAMGHAVIISQDGEAFLHSHPMGDAPAPGTVAFHTVFPRPGRYKAWGEFRPQGERLLVDFVIDVTAPSGGAAAPAAEHGAHGGHAH